MQIRTAFAPFTACLLAACAGGPSTNKAFDQSTLPAAVQAPRGHRVGMEAVGTGEIIYECRLKSIANGEFDWTPLGTNARLTDRSGRQIGRYQAPPATWEHNDGSRLTGKQVAVAPSTADSLPYQLVEANPAIGEGVMNDITYIQRAGTRGGAAPAAPCGGATMGDRQGVQFQADYIFYRGYGTSRR